MTRVKITLTCSDCGRPFKHIKSQCNWEEVASYKAWVSQNITQCPGCYHAAKIAKCWGG